MTSPSRSAAASPARHVGDRLSGLLPEDALRSALAGLRPDEITGPDGLVSRLTDRVLEAALDPQLATHGRPSPVARGAPDEHRGRRAPRTARARTGPARKSTPRDRHGVSPRRTTARSAGLEEWVLGLYAGGASARSIGAHLHRLYGVAVGPDLIASITRAALEDLPAWRSRRLDDVYAIVHVDALHVKVSEGRSFRPRTCQLAVGVTVDGRREALGLWWPESDDAAFWPVVVDDLRARGLRDILIASADPATGLPDAIAAAFARPALHTCLVHLQRRSMRYVGYRDRRELARDLRGIHGAAGAEHARAGLERFDARWGERYPMIAGAWRAGWDDVEPLFSLPDELRRVVSSPRTIEAMHQHIGKAIRTRGHFAHEQAATELIYLAIERAETSLGAVRGWTAARRALKVRFAERLPD